jgi:hypothetical protein
MRARARGRTLRAPTHGCEVAQRAVGTCPNLMLNLEDRSEKVGIAEVPQTAYYFPNDAVTPVENTTSLGFVPAIGGLLT